MRARPRSGESATIGDLLAPEAKHERVCSRFSSRSPRMAAPRKERLYRDEGEDGDDQQEPRDDDPSGCGGRPIGHRGVPGWFMSFTQSSSSSNSSSSSGGVRSAMGRSFRALSTRDAGTLDCVQGWIWNAPLAPRL